MSDSQNSSGDSPTHSDSGYLERMLPAARDGIADARATWTRTWDATGRIVRGVVYRSCYTVSYGVVFPAVFIAHAIPRDNAAVRGLYEGAEAAKRKLDELGIAPLTVPDHTPALASA